MRLAFALVVALAACGGKKEDPGPSCEQLTDHLLAVMNQSVPPGHGNMQMGNHKLMVQRCDEKKYPAKVRTCMLAAKTMPEAAECSGEKLQMSPRLRPPTVQPAGSGSAAVGSGSATTVPLRLGLVSDVEPQRSRAEAPRPIRSSGCRVRAIAAISEARSPTARRRTCGRG